MRVAMPTVGRRMTKSVDSAGQNDKLSELMDLVKGMTIKQRQLEEALTATTMNATQFEGDRAVKLIGIIQEYATRVDKLDISPKTADEDSKDHVRIQYNVIIVRVLDM